MKKGEWIAAAALKSCLLLALFPAVCLSRDTSRLLPSNLHIHGYVKHMPSVFFIDRANTLVTGNLVHNRINARWDISKHMHMRVEARNRLFYGEQVKMVYRFGSYIDTYDGILDLSHNLVDDTSVVLNVMLDRLLLNWTKKKWDITVGRQRINWGVNLVWNPNDIFNAFNYLDFDYQERPGSDAVRIQYQAGTVSSFELACKFSKTKTTQAAALMYRSNFRQYDWQCFSGMYHEDVVIGGGWAGNIKKNGFKGELSYFHPYRALKDRGVVLMSVSIDRSFKENYFIMGSYLYNSDGSGSLNGRSGLTGAVLSVKSLMPFTHSFFGQLAKSFSPIVNGAFSIIFSPQNSSLILLPSLETSISNNWDMSLVSQSFFQSTGKLYRSVGNGIYLRTRWSF